MDKQRENVLALTKSTQRRRRVDVKGFYYKTVSTNNTTRISDATSNCSVASVNSLQNGEQKKKKLCTHRENINDEVHLNHIFESNAVAETSYQIVYISNTENFQTTQYVNRATSPIIFNDSEISVNNKRFAKDFTKLFVLNQRTQHTFNKNKTFNVC